MYKKYLTFKNVRYIIYISIFIFFIIFVILLVNPIVFGVKKEKINFNFDENSLKKHVNFLTSFDEQRTYKNIEVLNKVGDYIYNYFKESGCDKVYYQYYFVENNKYRNVICFFKGKDKKKIIIGAHYDVFGEYSGNKKQVFGTYKGADDNASGIVGLLELSKMIGGNKIILKNDIELVAYTLEEPPFFDSEKMGSYIHAKSLYNKKENIKFMISLEMIGYFSNKEIQEYPLRFLSRIYPSKGNFIAIIGQMFDFKIKQIKKSMIKYSNIDTRSLSSPENIPGIDFSDHRNYWNFGYKAYMITDTSFLRNKNYHTEKDTIDTLDFTKMKEVIKGVYGIIIDN